MSTNPATKALQPAWHYFTVKPFSERHPAFTVGRLRGLICAANTKGLRESGTLVHINEPVLLNEPKFFCWVAGGNRRRDSM